MTDSVEKLLDEQAALRRVTTVVAGEPRRAAGLPSGALGSACLGVAVAAIAVRAMRGEDIAFSLPITGLVAFALLSVIEGVIAAVLPARRAGKLNVLKALQYE